MKTELSGRKWKYMLYTLNHPMDGFYWIRHRDLGSVWVAVLLVMAFSVCFSLNRGCAHFLVNDVEPATVDSLRELGGILTFYVLMCVSNWSITCLMNGEGRMRDIAVAIGYACAPMIPALLLATGMSYIITEDEAAFYHLVIGLGVAYSVLLLFMGVMQVHNYTLGKTMQTMFLTFLAILIIIFLSLLLADLVGQVVNFAKSLYLELVLR